MDRIRKELRHQTGHNMDPKELCELIKSNVLRPETLEQPTGSLPMLKTV
jgi:hypothetical protein